MTTWAQRARARFSQTAPTPTDRTDETPLLSVLSVPSGHIFKKTEVSLEQDPLPSATPAPPPPETAPAETGETHEQTPACLTLPAGVFIGETPLKMGGETRETGETPQNSNLLNANTEATPTPAPDLRSALPTPAPAPALTSSNGGSQPRPRAWFNFESSWRVASKAWQTHRATCPTCMAADRTAASAGTGRPCQQGLALLNAYEAALRD